MSAIETSHPTRPQVERRLAALAVVIGLAGGLLAWRSWGHEPMLSGHGLRIWLLVPAIVLCELAGAC